MVTGQSPRAHGPISDALCDGVAYCQSHTVDVFALCDGVVALSKLAC